MVLGIRSKSRKGVSIQVHYIIHVQEIKPWPSSQSLRSAQSVVLQWENGDKNTGSFASSSRDGKIEINESFRLSVLLRRETSKRGKHRDSFQKNCLDFHLYERQNDKTSKSQLLGSATINIADYGNIKETTAINTQVNCKKSFRNSPQPFLYINIQPVDLEGSDSSPKSSFSKEYSLDKEETESATQSLNDEDIEIASFTDDEIDDISPNSSQTSRSAFETTGDSAKISNAETKGLNRDFVVPSETTSSSHIKEAEAGASKQFNGIKLHSSSMVLSSNSGNATYDRASPKFPEERIKVVDASSEIPECIQPSHTSYIPEFMQSNNESPPQSQAIQEDSMSPTNSSRDQRYNKNDPEKHNSVSETGNLVDKEKMEKKGKGQEELITMRRKPVEKELVHKLSEDDSPRKGKQSTNNFPLSRRSHEQPTNVLINEKREELTSPKLPLDSAESYGLFSKSKAHNQAEENNTLKNDPLDAACCEATNINDSFSNSKTELNSEVQMLRDELREAAALEVSLYSVVVDHGSSANKVHAPARRLSRFYFHAYRGGSPAARASAAQSAVSGFVLVSKACGNDVPRLTFWLSNLILLRAIVSKGVEQIQLDEHLNLNSQYDKNGLADDKEKEHSVNYVHSWEDPQTFLFALEKIEAWIFSRIVESVWWQTLTPHMQSAAAKSSSSRKTYGRKHSLGDQEQGNFSIDLWKRAFKDACERLCPLRAGGHACGCLPVIARLVMEQLVKRLDVAMFNAVLRDSSEDMPTDPISDPISDSKVLPIPAGKSGFGSGAQLKNAIGNWSRWLSDLFDIDDSDSPEDKDEDDGNKNPECETSFKAFHLLNSLSDLMMLPFEMLADKSQRREVCPTFGVPLIRRILNNFVPDEFCPGPIPDAVLETLNTEDIQDDEGTITSVPYLAAPTFYAAPPAASVMGIIQEVGTQAQLRSGSSVIKKSYTSDDELDDLDSPLSSIGIDEPSLASKFTAVTGGRNVVRYELLREVWKDSE
ncbi:EEIG1/EHBP1 N-terminal domain containing protein [Senna tora]|uniref:EEIG1/EHBP1 N-terminal domain containing protein n=1 Tax=Senna tora TaxID=362788 RepID=A0A834X3L7_9FABA|nr:EEIG1/EHBP1 N-terminal domain containing protein [Senna tora]